MKSMTMAMLVVTRLALLGRVAAFLPAPTWLPAGSACDTTAAIPRRTAIAPRCLELMPAHSRKRSRRRGEPLPSAVDGAAGGSSSEKMAKPPLKVIRGRAGPKDAVPAYDDSRLLDRVLLGLFRSKLAEEVGGDVYAPGFDGLMDMIRVLNEKFPSKRQTQEASRRVLKSLFPSWLPARFAVMFSKPFPAFSSRLNAWVTLIASEWLMGPAQLNDVEIDGGAVGIGHGLLVERCRFLEAAGCASVCMNTCKVPTEEFFLKDMGLALEMKPDYEDFSCQFSFNKTPLPRETDESFRVACFEQCPSRGALREDNKPVARCHQIDIEES